MSLFGPYGLGAGIFGGLTGVASQCHSDAARLQALLEQQRRASTLNDLLRQQASAYAAQPDGNCIDAEFTVLDEQPALEHVRLLEDKR